MPETRRSNPERRGPALEVTALILSVSSGALFLLIVFSVRLLSGWTASPVTGDMEPGPAVAVLLILLLCLLSILVALVLAAVSLLRPRRGWPLAAVGWMVGASVLWYATAQSVFWTPLESAGEPVQIEESALPPEEAPGMTRVEPGAMMEEGGPAGPPGAILTSDRRDAMGFEGTFCWAPERASNCVEDAGIPLPPEQEAIAVERGKAADLVFMNGANPPLTGAAAYPLGQEAKTVPTMMGIRYLVPDGGKRALEKEELGLRRGGETTEVVAGVPAGEYVFQVSARPPEGVDSWVAANYHFRVLVLPAERAAAGAANRPDEK